MGEKWREEVAKAGGFEEHQKQLELKAAKQYYESVNTAKESATGGSMDEANHFFSLFIDFSRNPVVQAIIQFLDYISTRLNGEFLEIAAKLAEWLWGERSRKALGDLAFKVKVLCTGISVFITAMQQADKFLGEGNAWYNALVEFSREFEKLGGLGMNVNKNITGAMANINELNMNANSLIGSLSKLIDKLEA